jgi:hypothetical protein
MSAYFPRDKLTSAQIRGHFQNVALSPPISPYLPRCELTLRQISRRCDRSADVATNKPTLRQDLAISRGCQLICRETSSPRRRCQGPEGARPPAGRRLVWLAIRLELLQLAPGPGVLRAPEPSPSRSGTAHPAGKLSGKRGRSANRRGERLSLERESRFRRDDSPRYRGGGMVPANRLAPRRPAGFQDSASKLNPRSAPRDSPLLHDPAGALTWIRKRRRMENTYRMSDMR